VFPWRAERIVRLLLPDAALHLAVAALCGLTVGVEREWSARKRQRHPEFAGVRTFLLFGLLGGLAGDFQQRGWASAAWIVLGAAAGLVVVSYAVTASRREPDSTTEVAALLVLLAGALAGVGRLALASAIAALVALVLVEKTRIHEVVLGLRSEEIEADVRFAVLAAVVLPLLPTGPYGPDPGFRPRELWILVLLFSGLSFAGYIGLRTAGAERGYTLAGIFGGLISSTAVTLSFARQSREQDALGGPLASGVLAACTVLYLRVAVLLAVLRHEMAWKAAAYFALPFLVGGALTLLLRGRGKATAVHAELPKNPLGLRASLQMAGLFQLVLYAVAWVRGHFGTGAIYGTAALLGLTDLDALTFSMARTADTAAGNAARAVTLGILANTLLKLGLALGFGSPSFRKRAGTGLGALALATAASLFLLWRRIE
jgi:uncharacterized membrane protein (DUF4010 family)